MFFIACIALLGFVIGYVARDNEVEDGVGTAQPEEDG